MDRERIILQLAKCRLQPEGHSRDYTIITKLGQGGNGVAFLVRMGHQDLVAKIYVPPDSRDLDAASVKRFQREVELSTRIHHPFVIPVKGTGIIKLGSYTFPFYLMPRAHGTLRTIIPKEFNTTDLGKRLHIFTQVMMGVSYLHHLGIVHRDLKPENILLLADGTPAVADLGIAHVFPGFVKWSRLTLPKDQLMNWDYYAPEQRGGDATKVDHRADIYALGLILYELLTGISPARPSLPPLAGFQHGLAHIDDIFRKMTRHAAKNRYANLDLVLDDFTWTLVAIGIPASVPTTDEDDKKMLVRLLRSTNAENQAQAYDIARRLGEKALPQLHELTGDRRVDVALASYKLLGNLAQRDSVQFLLAGLYPRRSAQKPRFITGEAAADALRNYTADERLQALRLVRDLVLPQHIARIVEDIRADVSYPVVAGLYEKKLMYEEWGQQTGLALLLRLDQENAWHFVEERLSRREAVYTFTIFRDLFPNVNSQRQMILIDYMLQRVEALSSWELPNVLAAVSNGKYPNEFVLSRIAQLKTLADRVIRKWSEREPFLGAANEAEQEAEFARPQTEKERQEKELARRIIRQLDSRKH